MNYLLIDAGNTLCKFQLLNENEKLIAQVSLNDQNFESSLKQELISKLTKKSLSSIYLSTVKDSLFIRNLESLLNKYCERGITSIKAKNYPYISSQYKQIENLGSDRWVAILAQHLQGYKNYIVIDCGTAITIDLVINSEHLGGQITPGIQTSITSLLSHTNIKMDTSVDNLGLSDNLALGTSTQECISSGVISRTVMYIAQMIALLRKQHQQNIMTFITGGDAELIHQFLNQHDKNIQCRVVEQLVLKGLSLIRKHEENNLQ